MLKQPAILVVDDESANFDVIEILLFKDGYDLHYRNSGAAAIADLADIQPDLILLDVMMPDMDGIDVCQKFKNNSRSQHIPIIIITALSEKEDLARCLDAGANDFISKPINSSELRARVRSMLRIKSQYDFIQQTMALREEMMQTIVHDLRNPLVGIKFGCESLKTMDISDRAKTRINQVCTTVDQMRLLIDDILTIGRIESNKLVLHPIQLDLVAIAQLAIASFEPVATSRDIKIIGDFASNPTISGDPSLIRRVFENLLDNAIKFSPESSSITVRIDEFPPNPDRQDLVKVEVMDFGAGVTAEQKQIIFERYEVGKIVLGVSQIGIGLSFCKVAIEAHGGSISVSNNHPTGSIFTIILGK
jgi:signal transduction histidine kinase